MPTNFDLFIKVMGMTASSHDGEALNAIRKANALLGAQNMNWEDFLRAKVKWAREEPKGEKTSSEKDRDQRYRGGAKREYPDGSKMASKPEDVEAVETIFKFLFDKIPPNSSFREFLNSICDYWEMNGFITERQFDAIHNAYHRQG